MFGDHAECTQTHNNLAKVYIALQDWSNTATSYANVLQVYPDAEEAYGTASRLYHDVLFQSQKLLRSSNNGWNGILTSCRH